MNEYYVQGLHIIDYVTSYHRPSSSPGAKPRIRRLRKVHPFPSVRQLVDGWLPHFPKLFVRPGWYSQPCLSQMKRGMADWKVPSTVWPECLVTSSPHGTRNSWRDWEHLAWSEGDSGRGNHNLKVFKWHQVEKGLNWGNVAQEGESRIAGRKWKGDRFQTEERTSWCLETCSSGKDHLGRFRWPVAKGSSYTRCLVEPAHFLFHRLYMIKYDHARPREGPLSSMEWHYNN